MFDKITVIYVYLVYYYSYTEVFFKKMYAYNLL